MSIADFDSWGKKFMLSLTKKCTLCLRLHIVAVSQNSFLKFGFWQSIEIDDHLMGQSFSHLIYLLKRTEDLRMFWKS